MRTRPGHQSRLSHNARDREKGEAEHMRARGGRHRADRWRTLLLHPILLAAYPVIFLWAHNLSNDIRIHDVLVPLALAVGAAVVLTVAGTLLFHNGPKAGVIVSLAVSLFFS